MNTDNKPSWFWSIQVILICSQEPNNDVLVCKLAVANLSQSCEFWIGFKEAVSRIKGSWKKLSVLVLSLKTRRATPADGKIVWVKQYDWKVLCILYLGKSRNRMSSLLLLSLCLSNCMAVSLLPCRYHVLLYIMLSCQSPPLYHHPSAQEFQSFLAKWIKWERSPAPLVTCKSESTEVVTEGWEWAGALLHNLWPTDLNTGFVR